MYTITYSPEAEKGLAKLKRNEPEAFKKAVKLLNEIIVHPKTGTGHPEPVPMTTIIFSQKASAQTRRNGSRADFRYSFLLYHKTDTYVFEKLIYIIREAEI